MSLSPALNFLIFWSKMCHNHKKKIIVCFTAWRSLLQDSYSNIKNKYKKIKKHFFWNVTTFFIPGSRFLFFFCRSVLKILTCSAYISSPEIKNIIALICVSKNNIFWHCFVFFLVDKTHQLQTHSLSNRISAISRK